MWRSLWIRGAMLAVGIAGCGKGSGGSTDPKETPAAPVALGACSAIAAFPPVDTPPPGTLPGLADGAKATPEGAGWRSPTSPDGPGAGTFVRSAGALVSVPQVENADGFYDGLVPFQVEFSVERGVVACRVQSKDPVGEKEHLRVSVSLPNAAEVVHQSAKQASSTTFTVPGITLRKGESIGVKSARVSEGCRLSLLAWWLPVPAAQCGESTLRAESVSAPFVSKSPVAFTSKAFTVECRVLPRDRVEAALSAQLAAIDKAFPKLCTGLQITPDREAWGWPAAGSSGQNDVTDRAMEGAAAVGTWADPRLKERIALHQQIRADWIKHVGDWAKDKAPSLPGSGTFASVRQEVSVALAGGLECEAAGALKYGAREKPPAGKKSCFVQLEIKNTGTSAFVASRGAENGRAALWLSPLAFRSVDVLFANGQVVPASFAVLFKGDKPDPKLNEVKLDVGASAKMAIAVAVPDALVAATEPAIVRLSHDDAKFTESATLLRLR